MRWGLRHTRRAEVDGLVLEVPPGVLDPTLFRVGAWFAREVARAVVPGERLLDLGCGTGVVGALAARAGARVTATDLDPRACEAARRNGLRDVRPGDLFEALGDERYDRVCFNPPYLPGHPARHPLGLALYGGADLAVVRRFALAVAEHLRPGGVAWVAWSDRAPAAEAVLGPAWRPVRTGRVAGEALAIWQHLPEAEPVG